MEKTTTWSYLRMMSIPLLVYIYICEPNKTFSELLNILQKFGEYSSCKNVHKIQLLTFKYKPPKQLSWSHLSGNFSQSVKHLGVYLPNDMSQLAEVKYTPLFNKIKGAIKKIGIQFIFSVWPKNLIV